MQPRDLASLQRNELIDRARRFGVEKANVLTRAELCDEILRRTVQDPAERRRARGLLGVARDLVASVIERGLHLPDAAERIRGAATPSRSSRPKPPLATVTLAEIYAAQGHKARAKAVLDEVLVAEPDHEAARALRDSIGEPPPVPAEPPARPDEAEPPEPEEVALERFDVDALVLLPIDSSTSYVRWEVRDAKPRAGEKGEIVLRIVAVTATWDGPMVDSRDIGLGGAAGDRFVRDLPEGALVRAAVGWRGESAFHPVAVAVEAAPALETPADEAATAQPVRDGIPDASVRESLELARCRASLEPAGEEKTMVSWDHATPVAWGRPAASEGAAAGA